MERGIHWAVAKQPRSPRSPAGWRTVPIRPSPRRTDADAGPAEEKPVEAPPRERPPLPPLFDRWSFPLFALVASVYSLRATNEFVYDDFPLIKFQPRPRTLDAVLDAASQTHWNHLPYYRPLSRLLLAAERMAFGDEPTAYHLFNAVLAGLVAVLARALFSHPDLRVAPALAAVTALLVALHPAASEGVYGASAGPETLACFAAMLASMAAWTRPGARAHASSVVLLAAALLLKEQALALPLLFVWSDLRDLSYDSPGRSPRRWISRYLPVAITLLGWFALRSVVFTTPEPLRVILFEEPAGPWLSALYTLQSLVLPTWRLFYEPPLDGWLSLPRFLACALLVGVLGALCRRAWDSMRAPVIFWSGWFVLAVLPTANIFKQETRFAERYALLALPALAGVLGALASTVADPPRRRRMALASVAALTALAAVVTVHRGRYYATNHAFLQEWRATDPAPYHALASLGEEAHYALRWAEAERYYRAAVAVDPVAASFVYEPLGLTLEAQGKTAEAIEMYRTALRYRPQSAAARSHLQALAPGTPGPAAANTQDVAALRRQIQQDPNNAIAQVNLGVQLTDAGQLDEAVRSYREALRRDAAWSAPPADHVTMRAKAHYNLGRVLALQGHGPEAIAEYRAALVEDPNYAYAHTNLALLLEGTGARDEAIAHLQAALRVQPGLAPARTALDRLQPR